MPIYEYQTKRKEASCSKCRESFEVVHGPGEKPLTKCPECGNAVVKLISVTGRPRENILSPSNLADKGFTQYKNAGGGHFEKTTGRGPDVIGSE